MKKTLSLILTFVFVIGVCFSAPFALKANAASVSDLTFKLNYYGESYYVADCSESASGELVIPGTYNSLPVTSIGEKAFYYCTSLTSITIPDSVTSIGYSAFSGCSSLSSITIPDSVTSIGYSAFSGCSSLSSITIPDSVTSIGSSAFRDCSSLSSITIPDSVTSISDYAFQYCTSLSSITIPDSVTSIGSSAFKDCTSLTSITIPDGVTSIGSAAFSRCSSLTGVHITNLASWCNIDFEDYYDEQFYYANPLYYAKNLYLNGELVTDLVIPNGITEIKPATFAGGSFKSVVIPDGVASIGEEAFDGCSSLTSITIPDSVTSIGSSAFYGCKSLTSINITDLAAWCNIKFDNYSANPLCNTENLYLNGELVTDVMIPEDILEIKDFAFDGCSSLINVTIPDSVTSIGAFAFRDCSSLISITIPDGVTSIGGDAFSGCTSLTSITIPDSVTSIGDYAFQSCTSLTSVTIPDSVTSIGDYAFQSCTSLTSVTIPDSVTSIGDSAFSGCSSLSSITIPDSVTSIGRRAFSGCTSLTSITIPDSVTSIGYGAFLDCTSLTSVYITDIASWCNIDFANSTSNPLCNGADLHLNGELVTEFAIPEGVTEIKNYAFYGYSSLSSITIPDGVTSIGSSAFYGCSSLSSLTIPDGVTSIGSSAFYGCSSLSSITIPDGVTSIGSSAFDGCSSLSSITIPVGVTSIGSSAFDGCSSLSNITIPVGVTSIGSSAFDGCSSLSSITIPVGVTSIGSSAFDGCSSLSSITIPDSVTSIDNYAFEDCTSLTSVHITNLASWCNIDFANSTSNPLCNGADLHLNGKLVTELAIPESITEIKNYAFYGCSSLTGVTIPVGVTSIGSSAFSGCTSLSSITIPESVTSIGGTAFYGCSSLTGVHITNLASWCNIDFEDYYYDVQFYYANPLYYAKNLYLNGELVTDLVIPNGITEIKPATFAGGSFKSVVIPDGVASIGEEAFYGCSSLSSVTIPVGVTSIGSSAFYGCSSLSSITIPDGVTSIGSTAFSGCSSLTGVTIPDGVTSIGSSAFYGCSSLTSVTIPVGVTSIGSSAFRYCNSSFVLRVYSNSAGLTFAEKSGLKYTILDEAVSEDNIEFTLNSDGKSYSVTGFLNGTKSATLEIPASYKGLPVTHIDTSAFSGCSSLINITIPDTVTNIGDEAFYNCLSLENITIPESVRNIGTDAFYGTAYYNNSNNWENDVLYINNYLLQAKSTLSGDYIIKNGTTCIANSAFSGCSSLTGVTIPVGVTSIGSSAFRYCNSSFVLRVYSNSAGLTFAEKSSLKYTILDESVSEDNIEFTLNSDGKSYSVTGFLNGTNCATLEIPASYNGLPVTHIASSAFSKSISLINVIIPDTVTNIGDSAFYNCLSLENITIPESVRNIGTDAFYGTAYYNNSNNWDNDVLYIGNHLIKANDTLSGDYIIKNGTTCIANSAFKNCVNLNIITIPDGVTSIGTDAFYGCSSLTSITIPDSVINIGTDAFYGTAYYNNSNNWDNDVLYIGNHLIKANDTLSNDYTIKNGTKCIAENAFYNCTSLTSVTIPDSLVSINKNAFEGCSSLTSVHITNLDSWGKIKFSLEDANPLYYIKNLYLNGQLVTDRIIPEGVTKIKDKAFSGCDFLTSITIPASVTSIGEDAFFGCTSLKSVNITDIAAWCNIDFSFYYLQTDTYPFQHSCTCHSNPLLYAGNLYLNGELVTDLIIPEGVTKIEEFAFYGCNSIKSVTIPDTLTKIGIYAFRNCEALTSINITDIAAWCNIDFSFYYMQTDPACYFYLCDSNPLLYAGNLYLNGELVTDLVIPEGVTKIKPYAFYGCNSIKSVTIPDTLTEIGIDAFLDCFSLTSVNITDLAAWCNIDFRGYCEFIYSPPPYTHQVSFASNPLDYARNLYLNGELVTDLVIPDDVTSIGEGAFANTWFTSVTLPNNIRSIGGGAFFNCQFADINIPVSMTSIGKFAFGFCDSLKYVFYTGSSTDWENIYIDDYNSITSAVIHYNATDHTHNITTQFPSSEGMEGLIEDICPVCQLVFKQETLVYINDYITAIDTKNVVVDTTNNTLILDISACKDINDALIEMDGYTLTTTTNSDYGYYGTGSKVYVADSAGAQVAEYTLVVRGDVNGDSVCDVLDLMLIELARTQNTSLDGIYFTAGDLTENGEIDVDDFEAVVNKAKGI